MDPGGILLSKSLIKILLVPVLIFVSWGAFTVYGWKVAALDNALRVDSLYAVEDTTRIVFADSLRTFELRAIQAETRADDLDRELDVRSRARADLVVVAEPLDTVVTSPASIDSVGSREATLSIYRTPYTVEAHVSIPLEPLPAIWQLRIGLDPIPLNVRLSCATDSDFDVVPAFVQVTAPRWATIGITNVQQEPGICNPVQFQLPGAPSVFTRTVRPVAIGLGLALGLKLLGAF